MYNCDFVSDQIGFVLPAISELLSERQSQRLRGYGGPTLKNEIKGKLFAVDTIEKSHAKSILYTFSTITIDVDVPDSSSCSVSCELSAMSCRRDTGSLIEHLIFLGFAE